MTTRLSHLFLRTLRDNPVGAEVASHQLLVRAGYIRQAGAGIYSWLPLGLAVLRRIEAIVREEMHAIGAQEVHFPALLPKEPYEATGRWAEYGDGIFRVPDRKAEAITYTDEEGETQQVRLPNHLLAPTHEEVFTQLVKDIAGSYKDLPLNLYQIQTKYRDEARPRAGLLRGREFIMKDAYSFCLTEEDQQAAYDAYRAAYLRIFERLGLPVVPVSAQSGAMGGSASEEFLHPNPVGEDTFVESPGGYRANVEAVTTAAPEPIDYDDAPPAQVHHTPGTDTIATLVEAANADHPRADRPWTAADTLKNVVVAVITPEGDRQLAVIGVPGDREVDLKRAEATLGAELGIEGEVQLEAATEADLKANPGLVRGYIGPGLSLDAPVLGRQGATGIPYLVDPRIVAGTRWITGANAADQHVFGLVAGRDFGWDGTIESVVVRDGDPAPDGSGPLTTRRGIEMGHIFMLGTKYAEALGLQLLGADGKLSTVTMGSYGFGVTRAMAALVEDNHDDKGIIWPAAVAPADVHLVATGKGAEIFEAAEKLSAELESAGLSVIYDDRPKVSPGVKFGDAELLGVPTIVVVGRGLAEGLVEVKDRRSGEAVNVALDGAVAHLVQRAQSLA
ncbi:proline--tRNA ligase [Nesterenkonia alkaliphila]|uniref:Proline--tRNA ligase n=1 Tax=Nesterenkonia alkaliphila TaxID=1463631 RepID=A0A7K1UKD6_9MICC|nr:proline--tRNA ligase [Nesterenkonia alkaliphila]MVT26792.1 proline--tRNA ligase [Nesterenkonia alkaliphila]GFZ81434.1 proline--tRNA ligase [Nesterenkonia alkaliphila]